MTQMPWIRESKSTGEAVRWSQEKSAHPCGSFIPWEVSVLKTYTWPPSLALAVEHKDTLWDLPAVWEKSRVLGFRLPHLRPLQVCLASIWLNHQLSDAVTGKPDLWLILMPIRGSSLVPALVWGGRTLLPGTAQPTLWAPPGDPQAEPKACWREFGSFCIKVQVTLPLPGRPGCRVMHGRALPLSLGGELG